MKAPGNLLNRLAVLERQRPKNSNTIKPKGALLAKLDDIGERLRGGDLSDRPGASPAERIALALERGDAAFAQALLLKSAGRGLTEGLSR